MDVIKDIADKTNYERRLRFIILHYTDLPFEESLEILKSSGVSAHFLVSREPKACVTEIVAPNDCAYHAGVSAWQSRTHLNDTSIGIEIVNYGFGFVQGNAVLYTYQVIDKIKNQLLDHLKADKLLSWLDAKHLRQAFLTEMLYGRIIPRDKEKYLAEISEDIRNQYKNLTQTLRTALPDPFINIKSTSLDEMEKTGKIVWDTFPLHQIDALISLIKNNALLNQMPPVAITGHADIAPQRKQDPGPKFPWKTLAKAGIGAWPDEETVSQIKAFLNQDSDKKIDIQWLQTSLKIYGYGINITKMLDQQTKEVLVAFQMHFRPENYSGLPDIETCSILAALIQKYYPDQYTHPTFV